MKRKNKREPEQTLTAGRVFLQGVRDGVPIGLGYLAVAFTLGIAAKNAGLTVLQGFLASLFTNASAGEYAGFTVIAENASYLEMATMILVANARYLLMSCALSQKMAPDLGLGHRMLIGFDVTDEVFGITYARPGTLRPAYTYGAMTVSMPCWAAGTALGILMGELLPLRLVSAFSVALYGMFLAVIVPPARKNKVLTGIVLLCFASSFALGRWLPALSGGTRTILLTVVIATAAAILFPVKDEEREEPRNAA